MSNVHFEIAFYKNLKSGTKPVSRDVRKFSSFEEAEAARKVIVNDMIEEWRKTDSFKPGSIGPDYSNNGLPNRTRVIGEFTNGGCRFSDWVGIDKIAIDELFGTPYRKNVF